MAQSVAQVSQMVAQRVQISLANFESLAMEQPASVQMLAHSTSVRIQLTRAFTSCSARHAAKHSSQAWAQRLQASMHF
jgi:hypothetical protein